MEVTKSSSQDPDYVRFNGQEQVVQLWSYQQGLRLRHLSQVVGRNLQNGHHLEPTPTSPLPSKFPRPPANMGYYFTLHSPSSKEIMYSSELQCTSNPNWLEMHPEDIKPIHLRSLKGVLIRLWFKPEKGEAELKTSWGVHFSGLVPIGSVMPYNYENYKCNTLVLKLRNFFYTAPGSCVSTGEEKPVPLYYGYTLPLSECKRSYTVSSLSRLHSTKRAQRQQEIKCQETHSILEHHGITRNSRASQLATKVEDCRVKVALLREQLQTEIDQLKALKLSADNLDNQNQEKVLELLGGYQDLHRQLKKLRNLQEESFGEGDKLRYLCSCLRDWRIQLISQLPLIYPVTQEINSKYYVCGVHLPDAEKYDSCSDVALSVGLGYVAHILYILAQFLHVPLRYPISPNGSQATITDTTSLQLRETEREFPLFSRGKEREKLHFNYGVFLLNKNIAQMRWYCGILTQDLRPTLSNLSFLMSRLIQASGSQPIAVMPDVLVPPLMSQEFAGYEGRTPATLLQQKRSPQMFQDTVDHGTSFDQHRIGSEDHEDSNWKSVKSSSDSDSPCELSPSKLPLYVREVTPLDAKESTGKYVFVDHMHHNLVDASLAEQNLEERLTHANGFSFSLDNGLNHLGGKKHPYYKIKDLSSCDDLNLSKVSKFMNLPRGSDPSLITKTNLGVNEEEEETLPVFKEQTTELLRSWTEDAPSHYLGVTEVSSTEKLEEIGIECNESFMCPTPGTESSPHKSELNNDKIKTSPVSELPLAESVKCSEFKNSERDVSSVEEAKDVTENIKSEKVPDNTSLFLSELGVTEDMFLSDVAFRTAALASQNCSFKMSFSRQSTEDEYH